jgi:hypothetical protein
MARPAPPQTRSARFVRDYQQLLIQLGAPAFVEAHWRTAVLVGVGMLGRVSDRLPGSRRRTLTSLDTGALEAVPSLIDRVWPIQKSPRAPRGPYITLGQSVDNDIVLAEYTVSTQHCAFGFDGFHVTVADLGSLNGTVLEGRPLLPRRSVPVRDGATLGLGRVQARFLYGESFVRLLVKRVGSVAA